MPFPPTPPSFERLPPEPSGLPGPGAEAQLPAAPPIRPLGGLAARREIHAAPTAQAAPVAAEHIGKVFMARLQPEGDSGTEGNDRSPTETSPAEVVRPPSSPAVSPGKADILPVYHYDHKGAAPTPKTTDLLEQLIIDKPPSNLPEELTLPPERSLDVAKIRDTVSSFCVRKFGVDISARLADESRVHILEGDAFREWVREFGGVPETETDSGKLRGMTIGRHVLMAYDDDRSGFNHDLLHEHWHTATGDRWETKSSGDDSGSFLLRRRLHGFKPTGMKNLLEPVGPKAKAALSGLIEYATEKTTLEIAHDPDAASLPPISTEPGFRKLLELGDEAMDLAARNHPEGKTADDLMTGLQHGMLTASMAPLFELRRGLRPILARELIRVSTHNHASLNRALAEVRRAAATDRS